MLVVVMVACIVIGGASLAFAIEQENGAAIVFSVGLLVIALVLLFVLLVVLPWEQQNFCIVAQQHITNREPLMWKGQCRLETGVEEDEIVYKSIRDYARDIMMEESGLQW